MKRPFRRGALLAPALALLLSSAGCAPQSPVIGRAASTNPGQSTTKTTEFNQADLTFLDHMIPHHEQAVELADLVNSRTKNAKIGALAQQIRTAQQPEIDQLTALLMDAARSMPPRTEDDGAMDGHHMSTDKAPMPEMPGMVSKTSLSRLRASKDADFDALWLTLMVAHHRGAVEMADAVIAAGQNARTRALAEGMKSSQATEIATMEGLLEG
ncbi:MAG: DUF305 domain-containing protein [Angustibacter sp.]